MKTLELVLGLTMTGGFAYVIGTLTQNIVEIYKEIKADKKELELEESKPRAAVLTKLYEEETVWFNPGDDVEYNDLTGFIVGRGLNNTITIMLDNGSIIDIPVNKIRKVVTL